MRSALLLALLQCAFCEPHEGLMRVLLGKGAVSRCMSLSCILCLPYVDEKQELKGLHVSVDVMVDVMAIWLRAWSSGLACCAVLRRHLPGCTAPAARPAEEPRGRRALRAAAFSGRLPAPAGQLCPRPRQQAFSRTPVRRSSRSSVSVSIVCRPSRRRRQEAGRR